MGTQPPWARQEAVPFRLTGWRDGSCCGRSAKAGYGETVSTDRSAENVPLSGAAGSRTMNTTAKISGVSPLAICLYNPANIRRKVPCYSAANTWELPLNRLTIQCAEHRARRNDAGLNTREIRLSLLRCRRFALRHVLAAIAHCLPHAAESDRSPGCFFTRQFPIFAAGDNRRMHNQAEGADTLRGCRNAGKRQHKSRSQCRARQAFHRNPLEPHWTPTGITSRSAEACRSIILRQRRATAKTRGA